MNINLIAAATIGLLMTADTAMAQQVPTSQPSTTTTVTTPTEFLAIMPAGSLPVANWYKQSVYDTTNTKIGDIADVLVSPIDGKVTALIIGVGGFLGMGEKDVAVAFNEVKWTMRDNKNYPTIQATKETLRIARGFKYDAKTSSWVAPDSSSK
jgi:sporulation protein YlmC with PRC-barrel domain